MTEELGNALKWAREQNFQSVAARYAKAIVLAHDAQDAEIKRLRDALQDQEALLSRQLDDFHHDEDCGYWPITDDYEPDPADCDCFMRDIGDHLRKVRAALAGQRTLFGE